MTYYNRGGGNESLGMTVVLIVILVIIGVMGVWANYVYDVRVSRQGYIEAQETLSARETLEAYP